ncbi:hypothetical protein [Heyndrickxia camelliae]|uniref:Uncharacterized protein n=1 Tax=Heyndrickxia camelliae TaxID=1707093 RepID=A0A2N3LQU1_9BACI|nr:hypothetical protein [Heyndrickxia camelliae]PKR86914.1 hypothetical protein CWO92_02365 [Heyndrickxia camelliae]
MKQVMGTTKKKKHDLERIAVLRLELDYELAVLFEAMQNNDKELKTKAKMRLEKIRDELLKMKAI